MALVAAAFPMRARSTTTCAKKRGQPRQGDSYIGTTTAAAAPETVLRSADCAGGDAAAASCAFFNLWCPATMVRVRRGEQMFDFESTHAFPPSVVPKHSISNGLIGCDQPRLQKPVMFSADLEFSVMENVHVDAIEYLHAYVH